MATVLHSETLANGWRLELLQDAVDNCGRRPYRLTLQGLTLAETLQQKHESFTHLQAGLQRFTQELGAVLGALPPTAPTQREMEQLTQRLGDYWARWMPPAEFTGLPYLLAACLSPEQFTEKKSYAYNIPRPSLAQVKTHLEAWPELEEQGVTSLPQFIRLLSPASYLGARRAVYFERNAVASAAELLKLKEAAWEEVLRIVLVWHASKGAYKGTPLEPSAKVAELALPPLYDENLEFDALRGRSWSYGLNLRNKQLREKLASLTVEELQLVFKELRLNAPVSKLLVQVDQTVAARGKKEPEVDPVAVGKLLTEALTLWPDQKLYYDSDFLPVVSTFAELSRHPIVYKLLADGGLATYCKSYTDFLNLVGLFGKHRATTWLTNASTVTLVLKELAAVAPGKKVIALVQEASRSENKPLTVVEWANIARQWQANGYDDLPAAWILEVARGERKLTAASEASEGA